MARTVFFLAASAIAFAADKPAPPAEKPAAPASEDAIAAAKRDFDAVKAARGTPASATAELPSLATPEIQFGGLGPQGRASKIDAATAAKKKSANWLVDAMADKTKKNSNQNGRDGANDELDLTADPLTEGLADKDKERPKEKAKIEHVVNPLDRYMATWMTPQDLSLLHPAGKGDGGFAMKDQPDFGLAPLGTGPGAAPTSDALGFLPAGPNLAAGQNAPHENPFLQSFTPPAQPSSGAMPPLMGAASANRPPSNSMLPTVTPPAPPRAVTPDFVKPRDDEKYYKQMKRF